jgi:hypothetical protein
LDATFSGSVPLKRVPLNPGNGMQKSQFAFSPYFAAIPLRRQAVLNTLPDFFCTSAKKALPTTTRGLPFLKTIRRVLSSGDGCFLELFLHVEGLRPGDCGVFGSGHQKNQR